MISGIFKPAVTSFITPVARLALRIGITPNAVTLVGAVGVLCCALFFYPRGDFFLGSALVFIFALSDLFDGTMARLSETGSSRWGGFLDSAIDRITDSAILIGVAIYLIDRGDTLSVVIMISLVTGMLIPYIRAKAEGMNICCEGGIAERTERLAISISAIAAHGLGVPYVLAVGMWLLAVLGSITVIQRMVTVKKALA